ncbi:MAG: hypothetical protein R2731_05300 [Nocardioides sp.]
MPVTKSHLASLAVATTALLGGGVAVATAATGDQPASSSAATSGPTAGSAGATGPQGTAPGTSSDTAVSGAQKTKVVDAVEAAHDGVTVTDVRQDPDGSYDALGTDADGHPVFYDVSTDLATITEHTGGPGGHGAARAARRTPRSRARRRPRSSTPSKPPQDGVTVTDVRQDPDGSYDALGTDADGHPVFYDVSTDLATITEHTGGPGGPGSPVWTARAPRAESPDRSSRRPRSVAGYFGGIRSAPSTRTTAPFMYGLVRHSSTIEAISAGSPSRFGNGTLSPAGP